MHPPPVVPDHAPVLVLVLVVKSAVRRSAERSPSSGAAGTRTPDLRRARAALSQLSYGPPPATTYGCSQVTPTTVGAPGLEPGTSVLSGPRSNHLSYAPACALGSSGCPCAEDEVNASQSHHCSHHHVVARVAPCQLPNSRAHRLDQPIMAVITGCLTIPGHP